LPTEHKTGVIGLYSHRDAIKGWNNRDEIRLVLVMFYSQHIPVYTSATLEPATLKSTEALSIMPSPANQRESFEQLALPLLVPLYNHAFWLTHDQAEAEDLVQETLSKALRAFDAFEQGSNFKAWVFRILRNTFLTSRTGLAASRTVFLEDYPRTFEFADISPTPEDNLIRLDSQETLYAAIEQLPAPLRDALLLCDVEDLKYKEIADILNIPIGTVMSRVSRARQTLRQILQSQLRKSL